MSKNTKFLYTLAVVMVIAGVLGGGAAKAAKPSDFGLQEGWTISAAGSDDPDIYIVNEMGYKRLFLNPAIFGFYGHLGGFPAVKNVAAATRDAFPTSGLFRNCETNDPKVYGVESTGEDTGMLHWVNTSGAQAVADDANFFSKVFCINNNEFSWYSKGADYTSVSQVPNYVRGTTTPVPTGSISASLSPSNPASGTIVDGQARYNLAEYVFSGSGTVTSLKLKRVGVSADASLTNVYLYDGNRRLTDSATVSSSEIFFNDTSGLFTVSGSKAISVIADIDGTSGETIGVQLIAVNGNAFSLSGNLHTIATATLAGVTFAAVTTPSDGDDSGDDDTGVATDPANDIIAWQDTISVTQRYVWLKALQLRLIGSVGAADVQNFRLYIDGVLLGSAVAQRDANGYLLFDLSANPVKIETGSRVLKVLADIIGGSGKDFHLSLRQKPDLWAVDSQYGASVLSSSTFPIGDVDNEIEVNSGSLTITKKTDSPSGDIVKGAAGAVLAKFEFKAAGEKMKVENLRISNTSGTDAKLALRNAALFADGVQVGSTTTLWEDTSPTASNSGTDYAEVSLGSSLIVTPGTPRLVEIRADIYDASGTDNTAADDTFTANFATGSSNVQRMTTLDYVNGPTAAKTGNTLTIKTGTFTAGKFTGYANQSVVAPKNTVKLGHYTLAAASSEDISVNTLTLDLVTSSGSLTSDFTDAYVKVMNDAGALVYTSTNKTTLSATASNSYSVGFTIPKNKTYQVEFWANVASTFNPDTSGQDIAATNMDASGTTVGSSTSVTATQATGQTITSAAGSLTTANGSLPVSNFVAGGVTARTYSFTLTPAYDDFTLDEIYVDIATATTASNSGAVANVYLKDSAGTLGSATLVSTTGSASFTGLNLSLPQSSGTKTFYVDVQFANVGVGANDTGGSVTMRLDGLKYRSSGGTITTTTGLATATYVGNAMIAAKGYPTFTNQALPTTVLAGGTQTLFKTQLSTTGNQISWNDLVFTVASNTAAGTFTTYKLFENGVDTGATASSSDLGTTTKVEFVFTVERVVGVGSPVTLELKVTVGGTLAANDYVQTQISNAAGTTITTDDSATQQVKAQATASFVWSDQSDAAHATTTDDWYTDGLVKQLAEAQTLTK